MTDCRKINKRKYIDFGKVYITIIVISMQLLLLNKPLLACHVTDVDLHVGSTSYIATYGNLTTACVGNPWYCYIEWDADTPNTYIFECSIDISSDGNTWFNIRNETTHPSTTARDKLIIIPPGSLGEYYVRARVRRQIPDQGENDNWEESGNCFVTIGAITDLDSDKTVAAVSEEIEFEATASCYDGIIWKVDGVTKQNGSQTFNYSAWGSTGIKTVTASLGDSNKSVNVEIISGDLNVTPSEAYVGAGDTKSFKAWIVSSGEAVEVTESSTFTTSKGAMNNNILTASSSASSSEGADWVRATYNSTTTDSDHDCDLTVFEIDVTGADVTDDSINVSLKPTDIQLTGTLLIELDNPNNCEILSESRSGGNYEESFGIPSLSVGEYSTVKGTWNVGGGSDEDTYNYHIKVLGTYRHSKYVISNENCYSGGSTAFCYTSGDCTYVVGDGTPGKDHCIWNTNGSAKTSFITDVGIQGSGYSSSIGYLTREGYCNKPTGCTLGYRELNSGIIGCPTWPNYGLVANGTVAVKVGHPYLTGGDQVFVYGIGVRTVSDTGALPNGNSQLDHFVGLRVCGVTYTDFGNYMTIKLY